MGSLVDLSLDVGNLQLAKRFRKQVLRAKIRSESKKSVIFEQMNGAFGFSLQKVPEDKKVKNRAHPDVRLANLDADI